MTLNKLEFQMAFPCITREYTSGSCHNTRNPRRLPPRREMTPDSPAVDAEQFHAPNQTCKEPQFACRNSRESPRTPSHV